MEPVRRILRIRGVVQGVGFRPFVYRTALKLGLRGAVWNDSDGVVIDAEGQVTALDLLARELGERLDRDVELAVYLGDGRLVRACNWAREVS